MADVFLSSLRELAADWRSRCSNLAAGPPSTNVLQVPKIDNFSYLGFQYQYIQRDHNAKIYNGDIKQYFVILFNSYLIIVDIFMLKFHF